MTSGKEPKSMLPDATKMRTATSQGQMSSRQPRSAVSALSHLISMTAGKKATTQVLIGHAISRIAPTLESRRLMLYLLLGFLYSFVSLLEENKKRRYFRFFLTIAKNRNKVSNTWSLSNPNILERIRSTLSSS